MDAWQQELTELGLTGYQARVYLALVHGARFTAAEIARESAVPRQRIYDVLESLIERGLVAAAQGRVTRYRAVNPAAAIEQLVAVRRSKLNDLQRTAARLVAVLSPAWARGQVQNDPLDYVQVLRDRQALTEQIEEIQTKASREILAMAKLPYLSGENRSAVATIDRLAKAGGSVRCIYERPALDSPETLAGIRQHTAAGECARFAVTVPMRMWIVDRIHVLISLSDPAADSASTTNVLIEHSALAQCLTYSFEAIWASAQSPR